MYIDNASGKKTKQTNKHKHNQETVSYAMPGPKLTEDGVFH